MLLKNNIIYTYVVYSYFYRYISTPLKNTKKPKKYIFLIKYMR